MSYRGREAVLLLSGIVQISSGGDRTCALTSQGNVKCWGNGSHGQLGNDVTANTHYPVDGGGK